MSLNQLHNQISQCWIELNREFSRSQEEWNDEVRAQFDREYWHGLHGEMPVYINALDDLARTVQNAKQNVK